MLGIFAAIGLWFWTRKQAARPEWWAYLLMVAFPEIWVIVLIEILLERNLR